MSYSITVPDKPEALKAAAEFFEKVAAIPKEQWPTVMRAVEAIPVTLDGTVIDSITAEDVTAALKNVPGNIVITPAVTPTTHTGDAPVPGAAPETSVPPVPPPAAPAPVPPVPPADSTVGAPVASVPDAASVFGVSQPTGSPVPQDSGWQPEPPCGGSTGTMLQNAILNSSAVALDVHGLPWDARIHAGTRTKIGDGSWKKRKRPAEYTDPDWTAYVAKVEGELQGAMAAPKPEPSPTVAAALASVHGGGTAGPVPPAGAGVSVPPSSAALHPITTFAQLNVAITSAGIPMNSTPGQIGVLDAVKQVGLQGYPLLAARPDLVPAVAAILFPPPVTP